MSISIEELKRLILRERSQLYQMQIAEQFEGNVLKEGKYFRFKNNENYDPWFTYIKVLSVKKRSAQLAVVISFEKHIDGSCITWNKHKRKVELLGEEISRDEFEDEYEKFQNTHKHFSIQIRL